MPMMDPFAMDSSALPAMSAEQIANMQPSVYGEGVGSLMYDTEPGWSASNQVSDTVTPSSDTAGPGLGSISKWWDSLSSNQKMLYGAGLPLLMSNMLSERRKYQPPGQTPYTGPLSKFSYNPSTYTPYTYKPMAAGGQTSSAPVHPMKAIDDYYAQAQQPDTLPQVLAAAKAGDYNAMLALNKLYQTPNQNYAGGGLSSLGGYSDGGHLLRGPGDGVSDSIPATIGGKQPARLADGEFVVPARIVSELGNGSTEAGARKLYAMMDRVQKARAKTTGKDSMAKDTKAEKYLPT
jgi:hypothetical protein